MRQSFVSASFCLLLAAPVAAQTGPFDAYVGHYVDQGLPAEILCPASGFVLFADGQLLERNIGPAGVDTKGGYLCQQGDVHVTCTQGKLEQGALVIAPDADRLKRLTLLDPDTIALGKVDGKGRPEMLTRCPDSFAPMVPGATAEAFLASPPPAIAPAVISVATTQAAAWADVVPQSLPEVGVFSMFPRTSETTQIFDVISKIDLSLLPDTDIPQSVDRANMTPELVMRAIETDSCGRRPVVFTQEGLMLELMVRETADVGKFAQVQAVSICRLSGDMLICDKTRKGDAGFVPDPDKGQFSFGYFPQAQGTAYLCDPELGRDHPDSCSQPMACPASFLDIPVKDFDVTLGVLPQWRPGGQ